MSWSNTWELIKEDFCYSIEASSLLGKVFKSLFTLEFQVLLLYRLISLLETRHQGKWLIPPLLYLQRILSGCHINPHAKIGHRVQFLHPIGVVIGEKTQIDDGVKIFQHVTMGSHGKPGEELGYPIIGADVTIFAGATIIGPVHVGEGAIIGAGSLVLNDVPPYAIVAGAPAKVLRFRDDVDMSNRIDNK